MNKNSLFSITFFLFGFLIAFGMYKKNIDQIDKSHYYSNNFKKFLDDIKENSIRNYDWSEKDWEIYINKQMTCLPINNLESFYENIKKALHDLEDNHSYLIETSTNKNSNNTNRANFSIIVENGIGIITLPTLMIESVDDQNEILCEKWVINFHEKLNSCIDKVSKGWIIDISENMGGTYFPMIAALSYFFKNPNIGGFYFFCPKGIKEKQIISFDGQSFSTNGEDFLKYKTHFGINKINLPVVVLIGTNTSSSAEFLALALKRQSNIILIGQPSYGIATVNANTHLPDNLGNCMLTVAFYLDTNDKPLLEKQIQPSIILPNDKLNMVNKAKEFIKTN